jgi:hypothetical protein
MVGKIGGYLLKRVVLIGLPIYIVGAEVFVNYVLLGSSDEFKHLGPSVAVAGISLLVPVLVPKRGEVSLQNGQVATIVLDADLVQAAWLVLIVLAGFWIYCLYLAHQTDPPTLWSVPAPTAIGAGTYLVGWVFTELKEGLR